MSYLKICADSLKINYISLSFVIRVKIQQAKNFWRYLSFFYFRSKNNTYTIAMFVWVQISYCFKSQYTNTKCQGLVDISLIKNVWQELFQTAFEGFLYKLRIRQGSNQLW